MPTYLVKKEIAITRQEGDTADVVFTVPDVLDLALYNVRYHVLDNNRRYVFHKDTGEGTIQKDGQVITIPLLSEDTKEKTGTHRWEMELHNADEVITIGKGIFVIIPELIR
jgi:hypothetical protein